MSYGNDHSSFPSFFFTLKCFIIFWRGVSMFRKSVESIEYLINVIALVICGVYFAHLTLGNSSFSVQLTSNQLSICLSLLYFIDIFKCFKAVLNRDLKSLLLFLVVFIISIFCYLAGGYQFLLFISAIMIALYDVDYDKIVSLQLFSVGFIIFISIVASQLGIIMNTCLVTDKASGLRNSCGFVYPTVFASVILYFCLFLWIKKKKCSDLLMIIPGLISFYASYFIASSRTSALCSLVLTVAIVIYNLCGFLPKDNHVLKIIRNIFAFLLYFTFALFAIITLVTALMYYYQVPIADKINTLMSNRVYLTVNGAVRYGIHPFGSNFEMIGGTASASKYNFLDNSYALMFIRYGWVYFALITVLWFITIRRVVKSGNYKMAIVMAIIAFHCLSEQYYTEINFNLFLILPFAKFDKFKSEEVSIIDNISVIITSMLVILLSLFCLPSVFSYLRTFISVTNLTNANRYQQYVCIFVLGLFGVLLLGFIYAIKSIIVSLVKKEYKSETIIILIAALFLSFILPQYKDTIFQIKYDEYLEIFQTEVEMINEIKQFKQGNLYSLDAPEYYNRYFKGFKTNLMYGEEIAKEKNATVITDINFDSDVFSLNGFQWMQISDAHAIYTNDSNVINALKSEGYQLDAVYSKENTLDIVGLGTMNGIISNENNQLIIESNHTSISKSPYIYLHANAYAFMFNFSGLGSINGESISQDQPFAKLTFAYADDDIIISDIDIFPGFDENGNYTYEVPVYSNRMSNVYFTLEPVNNSSFWLNSISYKKF